MDRLVGSTTGSIGELACGPTRAPGRVISGTANLILTGQ